MRLIRGNNGALQTFVFDAQTGTTNGGSGTSVSAFADQSGFGNNGTSTSPHRPVYVSATFNAGTLPGIYFERVSVSLDHLDMTTRMKFVNGFSAYIYFKIDPTDAARTALTTTGNVPMTILGDTSGSFVNSFGLNGGNASYNYNHLGIFTATSTSGLSLGDGSTHAICVTHTLSGTITVYADAATPVTSTNAYDPVNTGFTTIGCGNSLTDQFWGSIAEIRLFNGAITASQYTTLKTASVSRWG